MLPPAFLDSAEVEGVKLRERTKRIEMLLGARAMEALGRAHVTVVGLGGVGSWCAEALCRSGIGALTLIDSDSVAESNINRQLGALMSTVGRSKAEVLAERCRDIAPGAGIKAISAAYSAGSRDILPECDYIADCIDLVSCKLDLIETAMSRGARIISALGTGNKLDAQQLVLCDLAETRGCPLARVMRRELRRRGIEHLDVVYSPEEARDCTAAETPPPGRRSVPGSVIWVPAVAGLLMAEKIVLELGGK